jgi:two-component system, cell cycle sensor histidine kinase and response regulator CckA
MAADKRQDETGPFLRPKAGDDRLAIFAVAERLAHVGSWHWDLRTGRVEWSDECFRILGHAPGSITPTEQAFYARIHPDDLPGLLAQQKENFETKRATEFDVRLVWPSGELRFARLSGVARVGDAGDLIGFVGTLVDLTELREQHAVMEQTQKHIVQAQKMEALGRLAAGVAHDFNNVLSVVLALSEQMQRTGYDPRLSEDIIRAVDSGASLTRQLLTLAKATPHAHAVLDLGEAVRSGVALLGRLLGKHVSVVCQIDPGAHRIRGDEGKLQQVLMNLGVNARDAMPKGGTLTFEVRRVQGAQGEPRVLLRVSDTGGGIPPEAVEHVFEPFFTTKGQDAGTGLGLSTVYAIVTEHEGTIGVEATSQDGTSFAITFPLAP